MLLTTFLQHFYVLTYSASEPQHHLIVIAAALQDFPDQTLIFIVTRKGEDPFSVFVAPGADVARQIAFRLLLRPLEDVYVAQA